MARTIPLKHPLDDTGLPRQEAPAVPTAQALSAPSRYHHPHFQRMQPGTYDGWVAYQFNQFTGREPKPEMPLAAWEDPSLTPEERLELDRQYTSARVLWSQARLRSRAEPLLRKAAPLWSAWTTARDELTAIFQQFWKTADGHWRAQLLRLTDAERAATTTAEAFDTVARQLAEAVAEQIGVAGRDEALPLTTVAQELGIDASDWTVRRVDDYAHPLPQYRIVREGVAHYGRATPLAASATQLIEAQRERLREVADLAGDCAPARRALV